MSKNSRKDKIKDGFEEIGLSYALLQGVQTKGYKHPTPIQKKTIPQALDGKDLVIMARTGSGKSGAFLIPTIQRLGEHSSTFGIRALIVSPTRDLALQTARFAKELSKFTNLRLGVTIGGESLDEQFSSLSSNPDIVIATPGRLNHLLEMTGISLQYVKMFVVDEADQLLEQGFLPQLMELVKRLPESRQSLLVSATMPKALAEFGRLGLHSPDVIRLDVDESLSPDLSLDFIVIREEAKLAALLHILSSLIPEKQQALIFAATKFSVEFIARALRIVGQESVFLFGEMDQETRKSNLEMFRKRKARICVVSDVAARGIDIPLLDNVVNYDFPSRPKLFVHRAGRVARAGRTGRAFTMVTPDELPYLIDLQVFAGFSLDSTLEEQSVGFGHFPETVLEEESSFIWARLTAAEDSEDLKSLEDCSKRAFKQYLKCRSGASSRAVRASKDRFACISLHRAFSTKADTERSNILAELGSFKPPTTIFEIGGLNATMQGKRKAHQRIIESNEHEKLAPKSFQVQHEVESNGNVVPMKSFRDNKYYIGVNTLDMSREDSLAVHDSSRMAIDALEDAEFEVDGEDASAIKSKKKLTRRWDEKKKRFVKGESARGMQKKNESGTVIGKSSKKINPYQEWRKKNRAFIPEAGSQEVDQSRFEYQSPVFGRARRHKAPSVASFNRGAKSELKDPAQMLKKRKRDAKESARVQSKRKQKQKMGTKRR